MKPRRWVHVVVWCSISVAASTSAYSRGRGVVPEWVRHLQRAPESAPVAASAIPSPAQIQIQQTSATPEAASTVQLLTRVIREIRRTRYNHTTVVHESSGRYEFDCSGLIAWVLQRTAPTALRTIHSRRPVAAEIAATIRRAPVDQPRQGWQRITRLADARAGDIFAWRNPPWLTGATGHTGFIMGPVQPVQNRQGLYHVRILDANGSGYSDDTRPDGTSGVGIGTSMVSVDPTTGAVNGIAVGWLGGWWVLPLEVVIGRVSN